MKQQSFSSLEQAHKKKQTKREIFLGEMDTVLPWSRLEALISPHCAKPRKGRPQMPLLVMLRIYFPKQWYGLSDPGAEEALYGTHSMRDFAGLDLAHNAIKQSQKRTQNGWCREFERQSTTAACRKSCCSELPLQNWNLQRK